MLGPCTNIAFYLKKMCVWELSLECSVPLNVCCQSIKSGRDLAHELGWIPWIACITFLSTLFLFFSSLLFRQGEKSTLGTCPFVFSFQGLIRLFSCSAGAQDACNFFPNHRLWKGLANYYKTPILPLSLCTFLVYKCHHFDVCLFSTMTC